MDKNNRQASNKIKACSSPQLSCNPALPAVRLKDMKSPPDYYQDGYYSYTICKKAVPGKWYTMKIALLSFILIVFCFNVSGNQITGVIKDTDSNLPIEYATVYINGTTIGTISDAKGQFKLSYDLDVCQLVINHISYNTVVLDVNLKTKSDLDIKLTAKKIPIPQISLESQNLRLKNMNYFRDIFLGKDRWGKKATILNDSIITFNVEYYDENTSDTFLIGKYKYFEVKTTLPLQIYMPKLGYILEYDLLKFIEVNHRDQRKRILKILGYSYFKEIKSLTEKHPKRIRKRRQEAYYHSTMHFIRSFFTNTLKENGYEIEQYVLDDMQNRKFREPFFQDSCECISYTLNEAYLTGLKGNKFRITYFASGTKPVNLTAKNPIATSVSYSKMEILRDTCIIRRDGTLPGGELLFEGRIVEKRMGAALPSNISFKD